MVIHCYTETKQKTGNKDGQFFPYWENYNKQTFRFSFEIGKRWEKTIDLLTETLKVLTGRGGGGWGDIHIIPLRLLYHDDVPSLVGSRWEPRSRWTLLRVTRSLTFSNLSLAHGRTGDIAILINLPFITWCTPATRYRNTIGSVGGQGRWDKTVAARAIYAHRHTLTFHHVR